MSVHARARHEEKKGSHVCNGFFKKTVTDHRCWTATIFYFQRLQPTAFSHYQRDATIFLFALLGRSATFWFIVISWASSAVFSLPAILSCTCKFSPAFVLTLAVWMVTDIFDHHDTHHGAHRCTPKHSNDNFYFCFFHSSCLSFFFQVLRTEFYDARRVNVYRQVSSPWCSSLYPETS